MTMSLLLTPRIISDISKIEHEVHSRWRVYPQDVSSFIQLEAAAVINTFGDWTQIIPVDTIPFDYDVIGIVVDQISASTTYHIQVGYSLTAAPPGANYESGERRAQATTPISRATELLANEINSRYLDAPVADTTALNFTDTDYSLAIWIDAAHWEDDDMILMGRYYVYDPGVPMILGRGWELYYYDPNNIITLRHHHGTTRTACYSRGWIYDGEMHLFGVSRAGGVGQHYRDGQPITTTTSAGGLIDPSTNTTYDLVVGCRYSKDTHYWTGRLHRPRAWSRALSASEHRMIFEQERDWFGV